MDGGATRLSDAAALPSVKLVDARDQFLSSPERGLPSGVRELVAQSWQRSLRLGVDPRATAPLELEAAQLRAYREAHPLATLLPVVRHLLAEDADEAGHIVAVGDAEGRLLWVEGHRGLRSRAERMHFVEGALWSERGVGTNAPGTALALARPVQIAAAEHYGAEVQPWSCVAAPVRDPVDGTVLGVVDLTGGHDLAGPRSLALVRACAAAMEAQLLVSARGRVTAAAALLGHGAHRPSPGGAPEDEPPAEVESGRARRPGPAPSLSRAFGWTPGADRAGRTRAGLELLGLDAGVLHLPERTVFLSRRHAEIVWLLASSGRGMTMHALDAALHEHGSHLVTIRSEMFRMRKVLGDDVLGSRPYRLLLDVTSDVDRVRQLLARGAVLKALDLFRGPPLRSSEAPGVVTARTELLAELRAAVLASRSVAALERWTATEEGHDDVQAWQTLGQALPYGSPKRATARAHLARLATSLQPRAT